MTFPLWQIARLRMETDGHGVTDLVGSFGCPLNCRYCINPLSHSPEGSFENVTPRQLLERVSIDSLYFEATGGGIMFGGGEPLLHTGFIREFREVAPRSWNLYAETSLCVPSENVTEAAGCIDHFYVDIKDTDPDIFRAYTGCDSIGKVLDNLRLLMSLTSPERITVRIPLIPDYNTEADTDRSSELLRQMGFTDLDRFKYRI